MDFGFLTHSTGLSLLACVLALILTAGLIIRKRKLLRALNVRPLITKRSSVVFIVILVLLSAASLRPYYGKQVFDVPSRYSTMIAAVDISDSMLARDIFPSRLEAVKRKLFDLTNLIKSQAKPFRIGIVLFAGSAYSYCPVTKDLDVLNNFIRSIDNKLIESGGSDIELGVKASIAALQAAKSSSGQIILFTDGEDEEFNSKGIQSSLEKFDAKLGILGFGKSEPITIIKNGRPLREPSGAVIKSRLNEELLMQIAADHNGRYAQASLNDSDLKKLVFKTSGDSETEIEDSIVSFNEYSWLLSMSALFVIFAALYFKRLVPVHFILLLASALMFSSKVYAADASEASLLYFQQDFKSSEKLFEKLSTSKPDESKFTRAWGNSLYRQQKFDQAEAAYRAAAADAKNGREAFNARFNLGNSLFMQQRFEEAIEEYEKALKHKPGDEKTTFNIELAKKMLEQEQDQQEQEQEQEQEDNKEQEQQEQDKKQDEQQSKQDSSDQQSEDSQDSKDQESENDQQEKDEDEEDGKSDQGEQDTEKEEEQPSEQKEQQEQAAESEPSGSLEEKEARAWLDSLTDSPLLLRRDGFKGTPRRQTW